ncbi:hypothetical protein V8F20_005441 [Naviculisporaceae sp. PSN 640]
MAHNVGLAGTWTHPLICGCLPQYRFDKVESQAGSARCGKPHIPTSFARPQDRTWLVDQQSRRILAHIALWHSSFGVRQLSSIKQFAGSSAMLFEEPQIRRCRKQDDVDVGHRDDGTRDRRLPAFLTLMQAKLREKTWNEVQGGQEGGGMKKPTKIGAGKVVSLSTSPELNAGKQAKAEMTKQQTLQKDVLSRESQGDAILRMERERERGKKQRLKRRAGVEGRREEKNAKSEGRRRWSVRSSEYFHPKRTPSPALGGQGGAAFTPAAIEPTTMHTQDQKAGTLPTTTLSSPVGDAAIMGNANLGADL